MGPLRTRALTDAICFGVRRMWRAATPGNGLLSD